jgi:CMP-N-acetylneuraminic acid synthetase
VILNSRKAIKLAFLDGYNDGDGATKPQKKWHSGRYKRFGSISQVLCLGLLLLISQTTGQKASVHCRDDKPHFTQLIFNSGENKRYKIPNAVKKTRPINYAGWVYDAETCFHQFCTGVGSLRAHNTTLVAIDALERYEAKKHKRVGHVCILQPTSPFRTSDDIDRCVQIAVTTGVDTVISVTKAHQSPYWMLQMKPFSHELESFMNIDFEGDNLVSQNLPTLFYPNGAVYVVRRDVLMSGRIFGEKIYAYMMPRERSIDLEEEYDFAVASALMPQFLSKEPYQKISWVIP